MNIQLLNGTSHVNWPELCELLRLAGLGEREPEKMRKAAEASCVVCSAYLGQGLVGFGRAISDGQYQAAIYDVVVVPEHQGKGFGSMLVRSLLARLPQEVVVLMYVVPGKQKFYEKLGFGNLATGMARFPAPDKARHLGYLL